MPMSPRLLRPRQTLHPEAAAWKNSVIANGGTVSGSTLTAVSKFCRDIDAAGIRDRFYRLNLYCGNSDASLNAVRTPLYRGQSLTGTQHGNSIETNVNFVQGDYTETGSGGGLVGNSTTKYLDTGFAPSVIGSNTTLHASGYVTTANSSGTFRNVLGVVTFNAEELTLVHDDGTGPYIAIYNNANSFVRGTTRNPTGHILGVNTALNDRRFYRNGVQEGSTKTDSATSGISTSSIFVHARRRVNDTPIGYSNARLAGYSIGLGMTDAQALSFYNAMQAFQTALGRNV